MWTHAVLYASLYSFRKTHANIKPCSISCLHSSLVPKSTKNRENFPPSKRASLKCHLEYYICTSRLPKGNILITSCFRALIDWQVPWEQKANEIRLPLTTYDRMSREGDGLRTIWVTSSAAVPFPSWAGPRLWLRQCLSVWALATICPWTAAPSRVPSTSIVIPVGTDRVWEALCLTSGRRASLSVYICDKLKLDKWVCHHHRFNQL